MKRGGVCILLFAFIITASVCCVVTVTRRGEALLERINEIDRLTDEGKTETALAACEQLEKDWESARSALFIFLDHESFFELDNLLPVLSETLKDPGGRPKEQIKKCRAFLQDMIARQQPDLRNIL